MSGPGNSRGQGVQTRECNILGKHASRLSKSFPSPGSKSLAISSIFNISPDFGIINISPDPGKGFPGPGSKSPVKSGISNSTPGSGEGFTDPGLTLLARSPAFLIWLQTPLARAFQALDQSHSRSLAELKSKVVRSLHHPKSR